MAFLDNAGVERLWEHIVLKIEEGSTKSSSNGVFYVDGTASTTAGTWIGTNTDISSLYTGLTVAYKIGVSGARTTTLNLTTAAGESGAIEIKRNDSALTTEIPVNSVVILVYDGTYWRWSDYNSNTNTMIKVYRQTTGYNADYPILVSRTATSDIGTAGSNGSSESVFGVIGQDGANTPTINPYTGALKAYSFAGVGSGLTSLNASNISSGTINAARLPTATTTTIGGVSYGTSASALGTSSAGTAATVSRSDHVHAVPSLSSCSGTLNVGKGGTGSNNKSGARINLGIASGTSLPSSGSAGDIFFLYSE